MTQEPVRDENWHIERKKACDKIREILANAKTGRAAHRSILQRNIDEIQAILDREMLEQSTPPISNPEVALVVESENPGW